MGSAELRGLRVLVTRPAHQAETLCHLIEAAGGEPVRYPSLAIRAPRNPEAARQTLARTGEYDMVVFISANAVNFGFKFLEKGIPGNVTVAAVGKGTAAQLERRGRVPDLVPRGGGDSDALLAMPELGELSGRKVLIVRGEKGRERLAEGLRGRGAAVDYAEVYRRAVPNTVPDLELNAVDIVTAASFEALANLERLVGAERLKSLQGMPLAVIHPRIAQKARDAGYPGPFIVAREPGDEALVAAIAAWAQTNLQD